MITLLAPMVESSDSPPQSELATPRIGAKSRIVIQSLGASVSHSASATAQIVAGFVVGLTVTDPGFGYTEIPVVTITDGGGAGAIAIARISDGIVTGFTMISAGFGYTSVPPVQISPPGTPLRLRLEPAYVQLTVHAVLGHVYAIETSQDQNIWSPLVPSLAVSSETMTIEVPTDRLGPFCRINLVR
jgi:hypothetical protein